MGTIRALVTESLRSWWRDRLGVLVLLAMPCLFALLLALPISERPPRPAEPASVDAAQAQAAHERREPAALPLGVVWGICCASVFGIGLLAIPVRRLLTRAPRPRPALRSRR